MPMGSEDWTRWVDVPNSVDWSARVDSPGATRASGTFWTRAGPMPGRLTATHLLHAAGIVAGVSGRNEWSEYVFQPSLCCSVSYILYFEKGGLDLQRSRQYSSVFRSPALQEASDIFSLFCRFAISATHGAYRSRRDYIGINVPLATCKAN